MKEVEKLSRKEFLRQSAKIALIASSTLLFPNNQVTAQGPEKCNSPYNDSLRNQGYTVECDSNGNVTRTYGKGLIPNNLELEPQPTNTPRRVELQQNNYIAPPENNINWEESNSNFNEEKFPNSVTVCASLIFVSLLAVPLIYMTEIRPYRKK